MSRNLKADRGISTREESRGSYKLPCSWGMETLAVKTSVRVDAMGPNPRDGDHPWGDNTTAGRMVSLQHRRPRGRGTRTTNGMQLDLFLRIEWPAGCATLTIVRCTRMECTSTVQLCFRTVMREDGFGVRSSWGERGDMDTDPVANPSYKWDSIGGGETIMLSIGDRGVFCVDK